MSPTSTNLTWPALIKAIATALRHKCLGVFNLNDGKWGRSPDEGKPPEGQPAAGSAGDGKEPASGEAGHKSEPGSPRPQSGPSSGPPDLDELWRDFNNKLGGLFGSGRGGPRLNRQGPPGPGGQPPGGPFNFKGMSISFGAVAAVVAVLWLGSGFYIVQEGQQAVITRFGKFIGPEKGIKGAGFNWRLPYPIERHEIVGASRLRSVEVGRGVAAGGSSLRDSSMLTQDENIVDIRMVVQYRLKDSADFLFNNQDPELAVVQSAESAIREVVGKASMNTVLNEKREAIANDVVKSIQSQLDLYKTGVIIASVNIQNVQPPEQVQAAFDDALKAGQDGDRAKNEGQAYANDVLPKAKGTAARLKEEAEGYKQRVVAQAQGDAERFKTIYVEYQKAPQVMRDRMYLDTMTQIYGNVTKIMVDSRAGNNLLYLPLDKIMQMSASGDVPASGPAAAATTPASPTPATPAPAADARSRESTRSRERDAR